MNKKELITLIAEQTGLSKQKTREVITAFCELTQTALQKGDSVHLRGFGRFSTRKRAARFGNNIGTGERIRIQEARLPVFRAGKTFREKVNNVHINGGRQPYDI